MFRQVINTMFSCIEQYEPVWKQIHGVSEAEMFGEAKYTDTPEPIQVSLPATIQAFKSNYDQYLAIYKSILDQELQNKFEQITQLENSNVDFPSEIWAKTVYSFIAEFHKKPPYGRQKLIDALRILWIGRVAVFLKETWEQPREGAEVIISNEAMAFKKLKHYLIEKY